MTAPLPDLDALQDVSEAYADAIRVNADHEGRTLTHEAIAANLASLTVLYSSMRGVYRHAEILQLYLALITLVFTTADGAERGGLVSDLLRDMEGF